MPGLSCGTVTRVTVQIPFELELDTGSEGPRHCPTSRSRTIVPGVFPLRPDSCRGTGNFIVPADTGVVTHADGTAIDYLHPAKPGEQVVMYAFGLGKTIPAVSTSSASPSPAVST